MSRKKKIPLRITDTTLRDAHQSLWATRMRINDIMEIIDVIDSVGYYSLEMWGGATFDVCLRFLRENPWERLRMIKARAKKTPLQMLLRGQNILGYKNYPDDLLDRFIALACFNGIDIFRVFDALNDIRNLAHAISSIRKHGGHAQGTISYTISPYHTVESYVKFASELVDLGVDTLCIKDMAGILSPISAEKLVTALVRAVDVPIQLHCHATSGMAYATYVEGVRAGAGAIDCAISPLAGYSSQPPVETMVAIFSETDYATGLDLDALEKVERHFNDIARKMKQTQGQISPIDPGIIRHQIPGGMISNLRSQLAQQNALNRLNEVLDEVPRVRADLGYPPLVTPTSQIVGTQAVLNILMGERYKIVPNEVKNYLKGLYGRPPGEVDPRLLITVLGDEKPISHRPADDIEPILPKAIENLDSSLIDHEEDIISYCLFPETALEYFKWRKLPPSERPPAPVETELELMEQKPSAEIRTTVQEAPSSTVSGNQGTGFLNTGDYQGIREVLEKVSALNITELVIRKGDATLSLKAEAGLSTGQGADAPLSGVAETVHPDAPVGISNAGQPSGKEGSAGLESASTIDSPLTGTFYIYPAPGKPPLVRVGDTVKAGDTVCIVEAMKLINEIRAASDCKILQILAEEGQKVQKGQPLLVIEEL